MFFVSKCKALEPHIFLWDKVNPGAQSICCRNVTVICKNCNSTLDSLELVVIALKLQIARVSIIHFIALTWFF